MKTKNYGAPFQMKEILFPKFPYKTINIKEIKLEDGQDEKFRIQLAIDECAKSGGGKVIVPKGDWQTSAIHLESNIHIVFEKECVVNFSTNPTDYLPVVFTRWEGMECFNYSPLIYGNNCENVAITGEGQLNGNGQAWWHWKRSQQEAANELCYAESNNISVEKRIYGTEKAALRPSFIQMINCQNLWIENITIIDGPQWMIHPVYCENVMVKNVKVFSKGHNTDGLNPDSCQNVVVEDCHFETGDDCIAINSGMNEDGWRVNKPSENIVIRNCRMTGGHGGVVIGSGMSGGVKNIYVNHCDISETDQGIRLKSMRGRGGYVTDVWMENIKINQVKREAIQINMFYGYTTVEPKSKVAPSFKNIFIKNVEGKGSEIGIELIGLPERKLNTVSLSNIHLETKKALIFNDVENLNLENIFVTQA